MRDGSSSTVAWAAKRRLRSPPVSTRTRWPFRRTSSSSGRGINDLVAAEFLDPAPRRAAVDKTLETLAGLARRGAERGARVLVATIAPPSRPELLRLPVWRKSVRDSVAGVNARLRRLGVEHGVVIVDFAAALDSGDRRTPDVYRADTLHLNAAGYQMLAQALRRALAN